MKPSLIRRAYDALAMFSVLNVFALGGLAAFAVGTGAIDGERIQKVVSILQGLESSASDMPKEPMKEPSVPSPNEVKPADAKSEASMPSKRDYASSQAELDMVRQESERIKVELDQRMALVRSIMLKVTQERESLEKEKEALAATRSESAASRRRDGAGFKKQVEILEGLAPKVAVEHLLGMEDPSEAAQMLNMMEPRHAKEIVEAAKRPDQLKQMKIVMQKLGEESGVRTAGTNAP